MKVIMLVQLACPLGVFNPGDEYENGEPDCRALIAAGCAYDPAAPGPPLEATMAGPPNENAAKRTEKPPYRDPEWLRAKQAEKSPEEIAAECDVCETTIKNWLRKLK